MSFKQRKNAIFCALTLLTGMLTGCGSAISVPDTDSGTASITEISTTAADTTGTDLTTAARTESAEQSTESARTPADTTAAADSSTQHRHDRKNNAVRTADHPERHALHNRFDRRIFRSKHKEYADCAAERRARFADAVCDSGQHDP